MTELEILRRRRELVLISAQLQRATVVRRLDHVSRHPAQAVLGLVTSVASIPLLVKLAAMVFRSMGRKRVARSAGPVPFFARVLAFLGFLPVLKLFPVPKLFNR